MTNPVESRYLGADYLAKTPVSSVFRSMVDNTADVLVDMRLTEALNTKYSFSSKLMEYLASGTPVITTCTGHVEEEFADIAYLLKTKARGAWRR